jgi:hypothetical protein
MLKRLGAVSLFGAAMWPGGAFAADQQPPAARAPAVGTLRMSAPDGKSERRVPEQFSTLFKINDDDPESNVPTVQDRSRNPLEFGYYLQDLLTRAEVETKRKDQARVIKYYRALAAALPEEAGGWGLLCEAYQNAGDPERALRACKYAVDRKGVQLKDYRRYVDLMTTKPGDLSPADRGELNAVLEHLDKQPDLAVPTAHMRCETAVKTKDAAALKACTAVLAKAAPDDPKTIVFQWSLAVMQGDRSQAALLLGKAEKVGVNPESIDRMSKVSIAGHWWSSSRGAALVGAVAVLLALLLLLGYRRRLFTVRRLAR